VRRESEVVSSEERVVMAGSKEIEGEPLILLQVNCSSILNKILEFWNLIGTCNSYVIICTPSWLREEIKNAAVCRDDYTSFRRDKCTAGGGVFIVLKSIWFLGSYGLTRILR
jgi:hypothetical protein